MQNQYVCDIGDFGKYGLLNSLCISEFDNFHLSLGVIWYLVPNENNNDGKHIKYLEQSSENENFRNCDPQLYDGLANICHDKGRDISYIREGGILPISTIFCEEFLNFEGMPSNSPKARKLRIEHRRKWIQGAFDATVDCRIIFIDPDNGLEVRSVKRHNNRGPKYAFFDELTPYYERGQSLVIYQQRQHTPAERQFKLHFFQINEHFKGCNGAFALHYHRGTSRIFFVIPSKNHENILFERAKHFMKGSWSKHFELLESKDFI